MDSICKVISDRLSQGASGGDGRDLSLVPPSWELTDDCLTASTHSSTVYFLASGSRLPSAPCVKLPHDAFSVQDAIRVVPCERFRGRDTLSLHASSRLFGAFLPDVCLFDAAAFTMGITEARVMDPQQRFLLEGAQEVLTIDTECASGKREALCTHAAQLQPHL